MRALGAQGQPVFHKQQQIRAYLSRRLGERHAALIAEAVLSEDGARIDWYSEANGPVLAWRDASAEQRTEIEARVEALRGPIRELARELERSQDPRLRDQGQLLAAAIQVPGRESYFMVGDQPVVCGWGFHRDRPAAPRSELSGEAATIPGQPRPRAPAPQEPALAAPAAPRAHRLVPHPHLGLLALPLLAALLWYLWPSGERLLPVRQAPSPAPPGLPDLTERDALREELDGLRRQYALRIQECAPPEPPVTASCDELTPPDKPARLVFAMDGSRSMGYPATWTAADDARYARRLETLPPFLANLLDQQMRSQPGERRMQRAVDSVRRLVPLLPDSVSLGLVEFGVPTSGDCGVQNRGVFGSGQRAAFDGQLTSIAPNAATPLAAGLAEAGRLLAGGSADEPAILVLVSDGEESCGGDPCATARQIKASSPNLQVAVIDLAGNPALSCIAEATGGVVYQPDSSENLAQVVLKATAGAFRPECRQEPQASSGDALHDSKPNSRPAARLLDGGKPTL